MLRLWITQCWLTVLRLGLLFRVEEYDKVTLCRPIFLLYVLKAYLHLSLMRKEGVFSMVHIFAQESMAMKNILTTYEAASGQAINLQKSEMYCSRNTHTDCNERIAQVLGVRPVIVTGKYLGFPSVVGRSKKATFKFVKDRIWNRINSWSIRCLS